MNPGWSKVESVTEAPVQPLTKEKTTPLYGFPNLEGSNTELATDLESRAK